MANLNISVGISDFEKIRNNGFYYVDKSGLIAEIFKDEPTEVTLITRPHRFGKTLGMSMLRSFFDIRKDNKELFEGQEYMKLEGVAAKGTADLEDSFVLFNCNGLQKGVIALEEMYIGKDRVNGLYAGDKRVALYPLQQDLPYKAGDFVCKMGGENGSNS